MCGWLSVLLLILKHRADLLGILMHPASSSTLMHQVLRLRVRQQMKCIGRISYSDTQSTLVCLSLALCNTRESRSTTRGWVSNHSVARRLTRTLSVASSVSQLTWIRPLSIASSW